MASSVKSLLLVAFSGLHLGCRDGYVIIDDWGPPAGFAAVQGTIRHRSGAPAPNTRAAIMRCTNPIGGFFGEDTSDQEGGYRVHGSLPPVGVLPQSILDTLRVRCDVFLGAPGAATLADTVTLRFAAARDSVVPIVRDLVLP